MPDDDDGKAWRKRLPLTVLRVRYKDTSRPPEPYPVPAYDEKTASSELYLKPELEDLISAVKQQWNQPNADVVPYVVAELMWPDGLDTIGQHCLARPMNCLGDNQDDSFRISPTISLDPGAVVPDEVVQGDVVAVVGTLATATDNATYVSLAINSSPLAVSFDNLTNLDLAGTASEFKESVDNTDKFYVYYLSRDCTGLGYCREIPESVIPFGGYIKLTERNYVRPGTETGRAPDAAQMLTPSVIILSRPSAGPRGLVFGQQLVIQRIRLGQRVAGFDLPARKGVPLFCLEAGIDDFRGHGPGYRHHALGVADDVAAHDDDAGARDRHAEIRHDVDLAEAHGRDTAGIDRQAHGLHRRQVADGAVGDQRGCAAIPESRRPDVPVTRAPPSPRASMTSTSPGLIVSKARRCIDHRAAHRRLARGGRLPAPRADFHVRVVAVCARAIVQGHRRRRVGGP